MQIIQTVILCVFIFGAPIFIIFKLVQFYKQVKTRPSPLTYEESINFWGVYIIALIITLLMLSVLIFTFSQPTGGASGVPLAIVVMLGAPIVLLLLGYLNKILKQNGEKN